LKPPPDALRGVEITWLAFGSDPMFDVLLSGHVRAHSCSVFWGFIRLVHRSVTNQIR
jgi:hypothetical protein